MSSRYYNNAGATAKVKTADGWLITRDLGFMRNGRPVIIGRAKDIIFVNGLRCIRCANYAGPNYGFCDAHE
ncbi:hypothetical protein M3691_13330 [Paenibacillus elgii]|nr:hypothetical protein [Paenibacillus elgii]